MVFGGVLFLNLCPDSNVAFELSMIPTLARVSGAGHKVPPITSEMYVMGLLSESVRFSVPDAASGDR